jgi:Family of unknown function (DUF6580)
MIPAFLLVFLAVAYRVAIGLSIHSGSVWLSNFAPFAAIALCSGAYFPNRFRFAVPLGALLLSDVILNSYYGAPLLSPLIFCRYLTLALVVWIGAQLRNRASLKTLLPASLGTSTLFYLVTNTFAWLSDPGYTRNLAGLLQSLTVGLHQYSATPTWMFYRNSALSDLAFTLVFVLCVRGAHRLENRRARAAVARPA